MPVDIVQAKEFVEAAITKLEQKVQSKSSTREVFQHRSEVVGAIAEYRNIFPIRETAKYLMRIGDIIRNGGYPLDHQEK